MAKLLCYGMMTPYSFRALNPEDLSTVQSRPNTPYEDDNLFCGLFFRGPAPFCLELNFQKDKKEMDEYKMAIGKALCEITAAVTENVLVVFPSRFYFEACMAVWNSTNIANDLGFRLSLDAPCKHRNEDPCVRCQEIVMKRYSSEWSGRMFRKKSWLGWNRERIHGRCGSSAALPEL